MFKETTEKMNKKIYNDSAGVPNNNFLKCSYSFRTRCRETFIECKFLSMNFIVLAYLCISNVESIHTYNDGAYFYKKEREEKIIRKTSCKCDNI